MIRSMTGFGRASFSLAEFTFDVEVRSVNQRHLDARVRLPRALAGFEPDVRARIQKRIGRGKVDLTVVAPESGGPAPRLEIDLGAAREYARAARELAREDGITGELSVSTLLSLPGVAGFPEPELPRADLEEALAEAVDDALTALDEMRLAEGEALERDIGARLDHVLEIADALEARAGDVASAVRERLRKRAEQLERETGLLDEARLHQEVVFAADRLDVTEEIVRLRSHVAQFRSSTAGEGPVGRRLEFLMQEMLRETNTIGSKGTDAPIAHQVVELKTELERIREQVLNVE